MPELTQPPSIFNVLIEFNKECSNLKSVSWFTRRCTQISRRPISASCSPPPCQRILHAINNFYLGRSWLRLLLASNVVGVLGIRGGC